MPNTLQLFFALLILILAGCAPNSSELPDAPVAAWPDSPIPTNAVLAHDPVMAEENGTYYVFTTGPGITVWKSENMRTWMRCPNVFAEDPDWVRKTIPEFAGHMWAPDIYFHNGFYFLYYSVSAFGKNTSCIGVATTPTLDADSPEYNWVDHGLVIQSVPGKLNWNAIDAQVLDDVNGEPYMTFGSFWSGLKLVKLEGDRLRLSESDLRMTTIASRIEHPDAPPPPEGYPTTPGSGEIEAPFIFRRAGYYYLFASIDRCCRGPESTYKVIVGRSADIKGPYLDREGKSLLEGGGTIILEGDEDWYAVGHNSVYSFNGTDYIVYHGYEKSTSEGLPRLCINELAWDNEDWPVVIPDGETTP